MRVHLSEVSRAQTPKYMLSTGIIVFLLLLAGTAAWTGYQTGLIRQIGALAGLVLALVACRAFGPALSEYFTPAGATPEAATSTIVNTYSILFVVVYMVVYLLSAMLRTLLGKLHLGPADRMLGAVFRVCEWLLFLCVILNILDSLLPSMPLRDEPVVQSLIAVGETALGVVKQGGWM